MAAIQHCLNCGTELLTGSYCGNCGQRNVHARLDFPDLVSDIKGQIFECNLPWLFTLRELMLRPGKACRDYVEGRRVKYVNPLKYVIYLTSIVLILNELMPGRYQLTLDSGSGAQLTNPTLDAGILANFVYNNPVLLAALLSPIIALFYRVIYASTAWYKTEITVFILYVIGNGMLLLFALNLLFELGIDHLLNVSELVVGYDLEFVLPKLACVVVLIVLHSIYATASFFREYWLKTALKTTVIAGVYLAIFSIAFFGLAIQPRNEAIRSFNAADRQVFTNEPTDWIRREAVLLANLESDDNYTNWREAYGEFLLDTGRVKEAIYHLLLAVGDELPQQAIQQDLIAAYLISGQEDFALTHIRALTARPDVQHVFEFYLSMHTRVPTQVLASARKLNPAYHAYEIRLAQLWIDEGATVALDEVRRIAGDSLYASHSLALWAAMLGDHELAARYLRNNPEPSFYRQFWFPLLSEARKSLQFKGFAENTGLLEYWRTSGHWADFCRPVGEKDFECF